MFALAIAASLHFAADSGPLYRALMVRAAPGRLLEVIDLYKRQTPRPWILRHSQGDQWDLMILSPMGTNRFGQTDPALDSALAERISWREEVFVQGPAVAEVQAQLANGAFYHIEMFVALPGKYRELKREREMESDFNAALRRPRNLLFTRVAGAAWDMFTVGVYRDIKHFAESADIPPARRDSVAKAVGFASADQIGPYLRSLISYHHDTLAGAVQP